MNFSFNKEHDSIFTGSILFYLYYFYSPFFLNKCQSLLDIIDKTVLSFFYLIYTSLTSL